MILCEKVLKREMVALMGLNSYLHPHIHEYIRVNADNSDVGWEELDSCSL